MEKPELELVVTVYNINPGMNEDLLEGCRLLKEYMLFVTKVRENGKRMEFKEAVNKAVDDCIEEGIVNSLKPYITNLDDLYEAIIKNDGYENITKEQVEQLL